MSLIPAPFLFRFTLPVARVDVLPRGRAPLLQLPAGCQLPFPSALGSEKQFAQLAMAWNPQGLALEVTVNGKQRPVTCRPDSPAASDLVLIWIDTRDTQNQHRGSRFCHYFMAMPVGGGSSGTEPVVAQLPLPRAREDAPLCDLEALLMESEITPSGYRLSLWFPEETLHGLEPVEGTRLGFYLAVHDRELGRQFLSVPEEFPYDSDPSQWVSLKLADASVQKAVSRRGTSRKKK